jgi:hypothetical protein
MSTVAGKLPLLGAGICRVQASTILGLEWLHALGLKLDFLDIIRDTAITECLSG